MRRFLAVCGAALVVAACSDSTPSAQEVLESVDSRTLAARTSRLDITIETGPVGTPNRARRAQKAEFAYDVNRGHVTTDGTAGGETIFIDNDVYTRVPPSTAARVSQGNPWLKRSALTPAEASPVQELLQPTDPIELLRTVKRLATGGELVGDEKVRDASTDHYRLTMDLKRLLDIEPDPAKRAQFAQRIADTPDAALAADLWVDDEGRVRRLVTKADLRVFVGALPAAPDSQAGSPGTVDVTTEWYDFGARVDIQPPPADQVFDAAQP